MNSSEVVFENIEQRIIQEIKNAHYAIFVSVAWFTNKRLFDALVAKAEENCYVSIIIQLDEINSQSGIDYNRIKIGRSECFFVPADANLLHDKFCIIDFNRVITGSYNWTYKASQNSENILIVSDPAVASKFISRFEEQKAKFCVSSIDKNSPSQKKSELGIINPNITVAVDKKVEIGKCTPIATIKKTCPNCKKEIDSSSLYCVHCGERVSVKKIFSHFYCKKCGKYQSPWVMDAQSKYCSYCGSSQIDCILEK